jgi:hypothetical protein
MPELIFMARGLQGKWAIHTKRQTKSAVTVGFFRTWELRSLNTYGAFSPQEIELADHKGDFVKKNLVSFGRNALRSV